MRALLIVNPAATTTTERSQDVLARALRSEVELTVVRTRRRGHAAELAAKAAADGLDVVVTLGGDGSVNETVNGLLSGGRGAAAAPAVAVVPGGSTNVFARALGLPDEWVEATGVILEALRARRSRTVGLGRADGRYFTFCAGFGMDAAVIRRVERARMRGSAATPALYIRSAIAHFMAGGDRRHPTITLERPDGDPDPGLSLTLVQNTSPWTYLGDREINPNPDASFDTGLDVMALRRMNLAATTRTVTQLFSGHGAPHGKRVLSYHDLGNFRLVSQRPQPFQLDGDYLGERDEVELTAVPNAIRVVC